MNKPATPPKLRPPAAAGSRQRRRRERLWLGIGLLGGALLLAWARLAGRTTLENQESDRLQGQALAIEKNLTRQLTGVRAALLGLRDELPLAPAEGGAPNGQARLATLSLAMPGVRSLQWLDAAGHVRASNLPLAGGDDESGRDFFRAARDRPDPAVLHVSAPSSTPATGALYSMTLSLATVGRAGEFTGLVAATLEPDYFSTVLGSVLYADDMRASLVHGDGLVFISSPADWRSQGMNVAGSGTLFSRHRAGDLPASVQRGPTLASRGERLAALRTLQPAVLAMDKPLLLAVSRSVDAMEAGWRHQSAIDAGVYAAFALAAALSLLAAQRRRSDLEALHGQHLGRLESERRRLELALHGGDLALWDMDIASRSGSVNARWHEMLDYDPRQMPATDANWQALVHPDDRQRVVAAQQAVIDGECETFEATYRLRHRNGTWVTVLDRGRVVERDAQGRPARIVGTHLDISRQHDMLQALRHSEARLLSLLQALRSGVVIHAADTRVLDANPAACRFIGMALQELMGRVASDPIWQFIGEDHTPLPLDRSPVSQVLSSGLPMNDQLIGLRQPGVSQPVWALCNAFPVRDAERGLLQIVVTFSDITQRVNDREALLRSQAGLRMAGRLARVGGWHLDVGSDEPTLSPELQALIAGDAAAGSAQSATDVATDGAGQGYAFLTAPDRERVQRQLAQTQADGRGFEMTVDGIAAGGARLSLRLIGEAVRDGSGRVVAVQGAVQDLSEMRRAEVAVRAAQEELAATLRAVPDLLFDIDLDGVIRGHHSPRDDLLVAPPAEQIGRKVADVLPPAAAAVVLAAIAQAHEQGRSSGLQYELALAQGPRWFELSAARKPVRDGGTPRFILLARDISERKQSEALRLALERQLRDAHKMESIGTLAGGIAHDFNNILAAILGNLRMVRDDLPPAHQTQQALAQIETAGLRARSLVQQILTFSRQQPQPLRAQPLRPVIGETLTLLRATLPAAVRLSTLLAEEPLIVEADATQLQQVLMNLCTNAWHALPQGQGSIEIGLQPLADGDGPGMQATAAATLETQGQLPPGLLVHLWVRDSGSGMDTATVQRIFDPFFTTKPVGKGTGLGLSVVHGIVRDHRAALRVQSTPGVGSTFHLYFPRVHHAVAAPQPSAPASLRPGRGQQLLYVDDDEVMRVMVQGLLQRAGYAVTACSDAAQALALLAAPEASGFELVVTDFNMPDVSGIGLAAELARLRPGLPVVITSGYITDELRTQAVQLGVAALLKKENTLDELPALVQRLLGGG